MPGRDAQAAGRSQPRSARRGPAGSRRHLFRRPSPGGAVGSHVALDRRRDDADGRRGRKNLGQTGGAEVMKLLMVAAFAAGFVALAVMTSAPCSEHKEIQIGGSMLVARGCK